MVAAGSQWVQQVCSNIGACKPMGMVASTLQEKTECGACRAVAMDIEYLLDRERDYKDKKRMKALVGTICDDLGMRHPQSDKAFIEVGRSRATTAALPSVDRVVLLAFRRTTAMKSWRRLASVSCGCGPGGRLPRAHCRGRACVVVLGLAGNIAGTFKLRKGMETSMFKLTQTWADKMCSDMSSYCPKPAGVEDDGVAPAAGSEGSDEEL